MGIFNILGTARDGILAQSAAMTTTGQNISNVSTPGYVRRRTVLEPTTEGGVRVAMAQRTFDRFSFGHMVNEQSKFSAAQSRSNALTELEIAVAPPSGSVADDAVALVKAFNTLAAFPIDPSLRADAIAKAKNLANTFSSSAKAIERTSEGLLERARDTVDEVNAGLKSIADFNRQVAVASGASGDSSGLRDQRDLAIREIGKRIGARAIEDAEGRVTLFAAGSVLVEGTNFSSLSMDLDTDGSMRFYIEGATKNNVTPRIDSGSLGGIREARDQDIVRARNALDDFAFDVANTFNAVHVTGVGSDGTTGRNLFVAPGTQAGAAAAMAINPDLIDHPERIGASGTAADLPGGNAVARALGDLGSTPSFGGSTLAERFADIATDVGLRKNAADSETSLRTDTLAVAEQLESSANSVSLSEEMVDLTQYQRAFEAATKMLRVADELLQRLMEVV
jgi:flagellar hook-associated protein 1 FlgK